MRERDAETLHALDEPARHIVDVARIGNQQRTVAVVPLVVEPVIAFHTPEVWQHVIPVPANASIVTA
jgi:hypothetical protein